MRRWTAVCFCLAGIGLVGCVYPTERSGELQVQIDSIPELIQGEVFRLSGQIVDATGTPVPDADIIFTSDAGLVATVGQSDTMVAVGPGTATISAVASEFENAISASQTIRIRDLLEIDSLSPNITQFGDTVSIFGTGLNPNRLLVRQIGGADAPVKSFTPADPFAPQRFGRLTLWVPPPAIPTSRAVILSVDGLAISEDSVRVLQRDIYEPNDTIPWPLGALNEPFSNPALAFELGTRDDTVRADWYRFSQAAVGNRTVVVRSGGVNPDAYQVFVTNGLSWSPALQDFIPNASTWIIGPGFLMCRGLGLAIPQRTLDSTVVAVGDLPPGDYDVLIGYGSTGPYEMQIVPEYRAGVLPDLAEENDYCDVAAPIGMNVVRQLSIDTPQDPDWFRFTLPTAATVTFAAAADNPVADLDLYLLQDSTPVSLPVVAAGQSVGVGDSLSATLPAGAYFLLVVDFAGVPTSYTLTSVGPAIPTPVVNSVVNPARKTARRRLVLR